MGFLLVLSPKIKVEAALCLGRNGPFKVPCSEQSGAAVVVASATKPGLFLKNTQQKKLLFVPLPPAASGGAAQLTFLPHPALPAKPASCGTCFPTSVQGDKPGCYNSRSTFTRFPSAWKGLDGRRSSPGAGIPATTGLERPLKGGEMLGAKLPRQSRESTSLGTLSIPSSCCSPYSILQRIAKRSLTFPVQGKGGRSFQKQISGQWLLCIQ